MHTRILESLKCLQMSQVLKESLAKNAKDAKVFLSGLCVLARGNVFSCIDSLRHGLASTGVHKYLLSDTLEKPRHSGSLLAGIYAY